MTVFMADLHAAEAAGAFLPPAAGRSARIGADRLTGSMAHSLINLLPRLRSELTPAGVQGPGYFLDCSGVSLHSSFLCRLFLQGISG